jgi:hypothetical protein
MATNILQTQTFRSKNFWWINFSVHPEKVNVGMERLGGTFYYEDNVSWLGKRST